MFIKKLSEDSLTHENGLDAQRLLPFPAVIPFEASWCVIRPGTESSPHAHHESEIFVAIQGSARLVSSDQSAPFNRGDTAFFPPNTVHKVVNDTDSDFVMYSIWWDDEMSRRQLASSSSEEGN